MNELALFAGAGGGILGGKLLGWRTVCAVEWDAYAASVLIARQNEGLLEAFPIWDDVRTFDGRPWRGIVDIVSGGFPCQDISAAGKGDGLDGERSGLWSEMRRIIGEVRPRYAFIENSPMLTLRGLDRVLSDLAALGFDANWGVLGADDAGAPHKRERIWIVAYTPSEQHQGESHAIRGTAESKLLPDAVGNGWSERRPESEGREGRSAAVERGASLADADRIGELQQGWSIREVGGRTGHGGPEEHPDSLGERLEGFQQARPAPRPADGPGDGSDRGWWFSEPDVGRVAHGVAARVDRLKAIGNGQVPLVAAITWNLLKP